MAQGIYKGIWLKRLLVELKVPIDGSIKLLSDSQSVINMAKNSVQHDHTKHIEIDKHFIKENIEGGIVDPIYVSSSLQNADILTKPVPRVIFEGLCSKLGMINVYTLA
ncbi:hypothetical protein ACOSQ2_032082 [Xanthoceras sorbifolium]